jgi:hypothetical protein
MTFKIAYIQNLIQTLILLKVFYVLMHIKVTLLQYMMLLNIKFISQVAQIQNPANKFEFKLANRKQMKKKNKKN